jgi:hypothetical protein
MSAEGDNLERGRRSRRKFYFRPEYAAGILLLLSVAFVATGPSFWSRGAKLAPSPEITLWFGSLVATAVGGFVAFIAMIIAIANQRVRTYWTRSGAVSLVLAGILFLGNLIVFLHGCYAKEWH